MSRLDFARRVAALGQFRVTDPSRPELSESDQHHLTRVLRAREGEELVLTDGAGRWCFAVVAPGGLERVSEVHREEPEKPATLYLAPLKGDRSEWVVAKVTELGVTAVVPLLSERVVVRWRDGAGERTLARWRRIADEAAAVARRTVDLVIGEPVAVAAVPPGVAVCDFAGRGALGGVEALAIGPEGGWSEGEWDTERVRVGLGEYVLRGDTAAVAAATLLVSARTGWSRPAPGSPVGNDEETR